MGGTLADDFAKAGRLKTHLPVREGVVLPSVLSTHKFVVALLFLITNDHLQRIRLKPEPHPGRLDGKEDPQKACNGCWNFGTTDRRQGRDPCQRRWNGV